MSDFGGEGRGVRVVQRDESDFGVPAGAVSQGPNHCIYSPRVPPQSCCSGNTGVDAVAAVAAIVAADVVAVADVCFGLLLMLLMPVLRLVVFAFWRLGTWKMATCTMLNDPRPPAELSFVFFRGSPYGFREHVLGTKAESFRDEGCMV